MIPKFDAVIHAPIRLQICALLAPLMYAEFQLLRDEVGVSDSVLSKHLKQLEEAGYVHLTQHKVEVSGRQRTRVMVSDKGRKAFAAHVATLQAIASLANGSEPGSPDDLPTIEGAELLVAGKSETA
jgi:DNA-binding MarR family transcriptional regulator